MADEQTAAPDPPPCGSPCGGPCTSRSTRRPTCSTTRSACSWPPPTTAGAPARTWTRPAPLFRASIVARARFIEDLVAEQAGRGVGQYVILGAGLDTFAQRRPELAARLRVFEVDQPGPQAWKRQRLIELGFGVPEWLRLVPVDFEAGGSWWEQLAAAGFDPGRPAVVASTGVTMYLTKDANAATLRQIAGLAPGSTLAMTFLLPIELLDDADRPGFEGREGRAGQPGRRSSASSPRTRCWRWPARPDSATPGTCRRRSPSATSPAGPTACGRPPARSCWWPRPDARRQRTLLVEVVVRVGGITHRLDPDRVTAPGREEHCHVDEAFLPRARDLEKWCLGRPCPSLPGRRSSCVLA